MDGTRTAAYLTVRIADNKKAGGIAPAGRWCRAGLGLRFHKCEVVSAAGFALPVNVPLDLLEFADFG